MAKQLRGYHSTRPQICITYVGGAGAVYIRVVMVAAHSAQSCVHATGYTGPFCLLVTRAMGGSSGSAAAATAAAA